MKHDLSEHVRSAGYEALFLLGGFLAGNARLSQRNLERASQWLDESPSRRQQFKRLVKRGLIAVDPSEGFSASLTELGRAAFAGGRDPEGAWSREWDGQWRLITFDLPRSQNRLRMRMRRWLDANHFGRLQGSVWIGPDPVPDVESVLAEDRHAAVDFVVFEGNPAHASDPREVAASVWNFGEIEEKYRAYEEFAQDTIDTLQKKAPAYSHLKAILDDDRRHWWDAVRRDPLLPKVLHDKTYRGPKAWKTRGKLLARLDKAADAS